MPDQLYRSTCFICDSTRIHYAFIKHGYPVCRCSDCGFMFLNPQPSDDVLASIYSAGYFLMSESSDGDRRRAEMKQATAALYLDEIVSYCGQSRGKLLEIGCGGGEFLLAARKAGFDVAGVETSESAVQQANHALGGNVVVRGTLDTVSLPKEEFDLCVACDVIEHVRNPVDFLSRLYGILKPGGVLFLVTPSLGSWTSRLMRENWMEFKTEHLHYFDAQTIQNALNKTGFAKTYLSPSYKLVSFEYVHSHFQKFRSGFYGRSVSVLHALMPSRFRHAPHKMSGSGINVVCRKAMRREKPLLSIIVPVYNEKQTFTTLMDALVMKELPGLDREIIIIESNSTDGTRDEVLRYKDRPGVRIILEDAPRGKGHAVRNGLNAARGDFVLIQDGDLEYDLNDYDQLLEPLRKYQRAVVLGSRHGRGWKMRRFSGQPLLSFAMNSGHFFFTSLLNVACGSRLKDPFTMYKVFRRDCVFNLSLVANRFDFDWELMIKLLRKGYKPLEIPVNYNSRSFGEGKKVSMWKDPCQWMWRLFYFRFKPLYVKRYERD